MMQQYFEAKSQHPGVLIAMRVGDFYEFYGEDADRAAAALQITLTARDDGPGNKISMAGVPYHSVEKYLAKLLQQGIKVALCDQLEDPKLAKGLVKRGVTRVLTPGTLVEDSMLPANANNYLAAICVVDGKAGLAVLDPSTGEFAITEIHGELEERLLQELARLRPAELLVDEGAKAYGEVAVRALQSAVTPLPSPAPERAVNMLQRQLQVANLQGFGCEDKPQAVAAAAMILAYAETNRLSLAHVDSLSTYSVDSYMRMDGSTRRSLEITQNLADGGKRYTLLEVMDATVTSMGARLMRRWLEQPLLDRVAIVSRQEAVERFADQGLVRGDLRDCLKRLSDIERLVSRAATGAANPRDLYALRTSLLSLPELGEPLRKVGLGRIQELREMMVDHGELAHQLDMALASEPPNMLRDGGVIKPNYDIELDRLRDLSRNGKSYIASLEAEERQTSGIGNLKVGFNSVFGYFLEVPKSQIDKVPANYIRKQTTANAERFITAELKEHESMVLGAEEKAVALESELFAKLRHRVAEQSRSLLQTARAIAEVDVLTALADVAVYRQFVKPQIVPDDVLEFQTGRHPVVEAASSGFVPNDLGIGVEAPRALIITGPNMAGKSTYLRQTALITLLAQVGSFVPAKACRLGLCDRIFARIGAKDELATGQSTFMVEMVESANILNHASSNSLVILDEVGRGTSTYDGLAIAWAMIERLAEIGAKTMFATHYHQLNQLADQMPTVANFRVAVEEKGDDIVWTHRVLPGGTDRSYGIHVAKMAGVPPTVLARATSILAELEGSKTPVAIPLSTERLQMTLFEFEAPPVQKALDEVDVNRLTPLEALKLLDDWKRRFSGY
jgi:DNA mismatch repair protein MutS